MVGQGVGGDNGRTIDDMWHSRGLRGTVKQTLDMRRRTETIEVGAQESRGRLLDGRPRTDWVEVCSFGYSSLSWLTRAATPTHRTRFRSCAPLRRACVPQLSSPRPNRPLLSALVSFPPSFFCVSTRRCGSNRSTLFSRIETVLNLPAYRRTHQSESRNNREWRKSKILKRGDTEIMIRTIRQNVP